MKNTIDENRSELLSEYSNQINLYEKTREAYVKIINEYNTVSQTVIKCSNLVAYVNCPMVTKWTILNSDGEILHQSDKKVEWETWTYNLKELQVATGTLLKLKAVNTSGADDLYEGTLEYTADSNTAFFELYTSGPLDARSIEYNGVIGSESTPPILQCSSLSIYNDSKVISKYSIIVDGKSVYTTGRYTHKERCLLDLSNTHISPGTTFTLKANCIAGSDCTAYVKFQYFAGISVKADFVLEGNAFRSVLMYHD